MLWVAQKCLPCIKVGAAIMPLGNIGNALAWARRCKAARSMLLGIADSVAAQAAFLFPVAAPYLWNFCPTQPGTILWFSKIKLLAGIILMTILWTPPEKPCPLANFGTEYTVARSFSLRPCSATSGLDVASCNAVVRCWVAGKGWAMRFISCPCRAV